MYYGVRVESMSRLAGQRSLAATSLAMAQGQLTRSSFEEGYCVSGLLSMIG